MPNIDLSILNQRQTPAFYADVFANRPAAGYVGRIFVSTDTFAFYRDNGTGWDLIGGPGTGTVTGSGASGQIALWSGASTIVGDTGLTYDGTANSLTASKFIVTGGTSSQFLKADGSVDSSSYVPYTGASASLNMGANNILAQNYYVDGNGTNSGGFLGIKQYSGSSSGINGYTSISALTQNSLYFQFSQTNGTNKTFELSTALLGTTIRQYQVPNADGTIALTSNIPSVSGTAGQIAYFNGSTSITGDNGLFYDSVNDRIGIGTITPGAAIDAHSSANIIAQLNQTTATNNSLLAFQNSGAGLWRIGNFYNGGANDLGIFDVIGNIQPVTVKKTTGQVLIGTSTVGSGKLVVASATGDNGIQIVGASAPSLRIDSAESGPTKRAGLGISTATNNFIQGSADRDFCIFNGSTAAASPILFGIYDAGAVNVQEAARISPARNFLLGTTTDAGQRLQVSGTALISGTSTFSTGALFSASATLLNSDNSIFRYTNNYMYVQGATAGGLWLAGGSTRNNNIAIRETLNSISLYTSGNENFIIDSSGNVGIGTTNANPYGFGGGGKFMTLYNPTSYSLLSIISNSTSSGGLTFGNETIRRSSIDALNGSDLAFYTNGSNSGTTVTERARITSSGNLLIGTTTDAGQKLQVNGVIRASDYITNSNNGYTETYVDILYNATRTYTITGNVKGFIQIMVGVYLDGAGTSARALWFGGGFLNGAYLPYTEIVRVNDTYLTISAINSNQFSTQFTIQNTFANNANIAISILSGSTNAKPNITSA